MDVLLIGAGVIGTVYGAQIARAGHTVGVLGHGRRTRQIQRTGLAITDLATGRSLTGPCTVVSDIPTRDFDLVLSPCAPTTRLHSHTPVRCQALLSWLDSWTHRLPGSTLPMSTPRWSGRSSTTSKTQRGNCATTRNNLHAAIHSLFSYAALHCPEHAATIARVLPIPPKRTHTTVVCFLTQDEVEALLTSPDRTTRLGHALLLVAVQTGLRVSER